MVARQGRVRDAEMGEWRGRLENARAFHRAARHLLDTHEIGANGNPVLLMIVHAAIAYGDALSSQAGGKVNQKDHSRLPKVVATALGQRSEVAQVKRLTELLAEKDPAAYGARGGRMEHAAQLMEKLDRFARWAEDLLAAR